jgi:hypothetical protein
MGFLRTTGFGNQLQRQLAHGQISPLPPSSNVVNLAASPPTNSAAQKPLAEPVDMHHQVLVRLFHLGHRMGFQAQLFSDKGLYEHLGSVLS